MPLSFECHGVSYAHLIIFLILSVFFSRFCPCCAMVSCHRCVSKRVFEVVSRLPTNVCVHCYRESSRIFQPPQAVQDETAIDESLRGKWWRPEEVSSSSLMLTCVVYAMLAPTFNQALVILPLIVLLSPISSKNHQIRLDEGITYLKEMEGIITIW